MSYALGIADARSPSTDVHVSSKLTLSIMSGKTEFEIVAEKMVNIRNARVGSETEISLNEPDSMPFEIAPSAHYSLHTGLFYSTVICR